MLDEKDKFILSDKNTIESPTKAQKNGGNILRTKLPASYRLIDREEKWGIDTNENKYDRVTENNIGEEVITTTIIPNEKNAKRESAITQIKNRFEASKNVKVGTSKPNNPDIKAVGVYDFLPIVKLLSTKNVIVVCDDVIEDELPEEKR